MRQQEGLDVVVGGDESLDLPLRGREVVLDLQGDDGAVERIIGLEEVEGDVVDQVIDLVGIALDDSGDVVEPELRGLEGRGPGGGGGERESVGWGEGVSGRGE